MKKNSIATWALAAWSALALFAQAKATGTEGDIYSINPVNEYNTTITTTGKTYEPGETIYFRVRLLSSAYNSPTPGKWDKKWVGAGSETLDDLYNPPMLGIVVSGRLRSATIKDIVYGEATAGSDTVYPYSDLVCSYTVQPGDLALPVRLAVVDDTASEGWKVAGDSSSSNGFYLFNSDRWNICDGSGNVCNLFYCTGTAAGQARSTWGSNTTPSLGAQVTDYDLSKANFQVKGIDFDSNMDSSAYWRIVSEGTTATTYTPTIVTVGEPTSSVTLYVWSDDESSVEMAGDAESMSITLEDGSTVTRMVKTVKIVTGEKTYPITMKGKAHGTSTKLYLSATPGFIFDAAGYAVKNSYLTAEVYCSDPPSPNIQFSFDPANPTSAKSKTVATSTNTTENLAIDAVPVYVTLSEAYASDLDVQVKVRLEADPTVDVISNRNIAVSKSSDSFSSSDVSYTNFTLKAGATSAIFYVYPLGGTAQTQSEGISFTPVLTDAAAQAKYEIGNPCTLKIKSSHKPVIVSPADEADLGEQEVNGFTVPVEINDCYRDLRIPGGFKVDVTFGDGSKMETTNVVFSENVESQVLLKGYGAEPKYATIRVTEPDGTGYGQVKVYFTVRPTKTVVAELYDTTSQTNANLRTEYSEGESALVRFKLSEALPIGQKLYAFLIPLTEASSNLVSSSVFSNGVEIVGGETQTGLSISTALKFLDGCAATESALLRYRIELRTAQALDDASGQVDETYAAVQELKINVENVVPTLDALYIAGNPTSTPRGGYYDNGGSGLPATVAQDFSVSYTDASQIDVTNGLITLWCFSEGRKSSNYKYSCTTSYIDSVSVKHAFTAGGVTQTVSFVTIDKDMLAALGEITSANLKTIWASALKLVGGEAYTVSVYVGTAPQVIIEPSTLTVNETDSTAEFAISLSEAPTAEVKVEVAFAPMNGTGDPLKDGTLSFVATNFTFKADATSPSAPNKTLSIDTDLLDGTRYSSTRGFYVTARVITDEENDDGVVWSNFYGYAEAEVYIYNMPPTITPPEPLYMTTNTSHALNETFSISDWSVSDVAADLAAGLKCRWYVDDVEQKLLATTVTDETEHSTDFKLTTEGLHIIKLVVTDKDNVGEEAGNGYASREWLYYITPTKQLQVTAVGPSLSAQSYYAPYGGRGRIWAESCGQGIIENFTHRYYYSVNTAQARIHAYAYAANETSDNGGLGSISGRDVAIDSTGNGSWPNKTLASYYAPHEDEDIALDNFFYNWVYITPSDAGGAPTIEYGTPNPQTKSSADVSTTITLDTYEADKQSYASRIVEAVFSAEKYWSDNMGDINGDGIPDLYVSHYSLGGSNATERADVANINAANDDADYLPSSALNVSNSLAFTALDEIRGAANLGAGAGLNNAPKLLGLRNMPTPDVRYTDPTTDEQSTLSYLEWLSFCDWCASQDPALEPTEEANWAKWSPERPTDPTLEDTDGDGYPDGVEYYYWYRSHVGYFDKGVEKAENFRRQTGRRYVPARPCDPEIIPASEIEQIFDPLSKNGHLDWSNTDTDNDGLPDYLEVTQTHTSPIDYDSDGDGLPDGYENMIGFDPLKVSTDGVTLDMARNDDGDVMAKTPVNMVLWGVVDATGATNLFCSAEDPQYEAGATIAEAVSNFYGVIRYRNAYNLDPEELIRTRFYSTEAECAFLKDCTALGTLAVTTNLYAIHSDVYETAGFDPRTGWGLYTECTNSVAFTQYDEFMVYAWKLNTDRAVSGSTFEEQWQYACPSGFAADSDKDGAPDGWELYVKLDAVSTDLDATLPIETEIIKKSSDDGLLPWEEFCSMRSIEWATAYCTLDTTLVNKYPEWTNKKWPTDPWNRDTDGDGIDDAEERTYFAYGSPTKAGAGGGLNPTSWDTDDDYLPDPWEVEFAGTPSNSTDTASSSSNATAVVWNDDGMDGTVNDAKKDYDHDGLLNWQEYLVGSIRAFRYDDTVSQWGTEWPKDGADAMPSPDDEEAWGKYWYNVLVDPTGIDKDSEEVSSKLFNPHFALDQGMFDASMAYFSCNTNAWENETVYRHFYMFRDGVYHDLKNPPADMYFTGSGSSKKLYNRYTWKMRGKAYSAFTLEFYDDKDELEYRPIYPKYYICCDPTKADTDGDGMDDYYELFHGMNPLLGASGLASGACDIVFRAYSACKPSVWDESNSGGFWNGENNWWMSAGGDSDHTEKTDERRVKEGSLFDFINFPWLAGLASADPDGDDARNIEESIQANLQAASTYLHTDPTPLWMTDSSYADSLTVRYYYPIPKMLEKVVVKSVTTNSFTYTNPYTGEKVTRMFDEFPGLHWTGSSLTEENTGLAYWASGTQFDFEENEGYDSDHDFLSDTEERQGITHKASDPQDHDDPLRRQAMWFGGAAEPGFLETPLAKEENAPAGVASGNEEPFEYFTAECWAKPDAATYQGSADQVVLERSVAVADAGPADEQLVRKNFIIGIRQGHWFCGFDSAGTGSERQRNLIDNGPEATTNWTYLAASYDGKNLTLYVGEDGKLTAYTKAVGRHPEHGLVTPLVDATGELAGSLTLAYSGRKVISMMVGASVKTYYGHIFDFNVPMVHTTNLEDYGDFYRGYVDEVRVWDGARSEADLNSDFQNKTRYTAELASENRDAVYEKWEQGASRVESNANGTLPAELRYHWAFDHLTGAVNVEDVVREPAGFATAADITDAKAIWSRPDDWVCPWRSGLDASIKSTVYTDEAYVPWINDTVSHLPRFDGTTVDSIYWTENSAGNQSATKLGYGVFSFNRSHEVWSKWSQMSTATPTRFDNLNAASSNLVMMANFTYRNSYTIGCDMLPFGSAFPKRISNAEGGLWDEQGASDAWAQTGVDADNNHLPDWWEEYARENYGQNLDPEATIDWSTQISYNGVEMTAGEAYARDLFNGLLPDGLYSAIYADTRDKNFDGVYDFYAELYDLDDGDAGLDNDGDGLSNYAEYLITEVFNFAQCDPNQYATPDTNETNNGVCDYFKKVGDLYLGEIFTDHDQMTDTEEGKLDGLNRSVYDADRDADGDGWTNYAEYRANSDESTWVQVGTQSNVVTVAFEEPSSALSAFLATNTATILTTDRCYSGSGVYWTGSGDGALAHRFEAGDWVPVANTGISWNGSVTGVRYTMYAPEPIYAYLGYPTPNVSATVTYVGAQTLGAIHVKAWSDPKMLTKPDAVWTAAASNGTAAATGVYTLSLKTPDTGMLKEGLNAFIVWADIDGGTEGEYDIGEPMGFVKDVDVGWNSASFAVTLSETSGISPRVKIWDSATSDRSVTWSEYSEPALDDMLATEEQKGYLSNVVQRTSAETGKSKVHLRVVRFGVNDSYAYCLGVGWDLIPVIDNVYDANGRDFLCEGDFLQDGEFDIEWSSLKDDVLANLGVWDYCPLGVSNMTYLAVLEGGAGYESWILNAEDSNTVIRALSTRIERRFELTKHAPKAERIDGVFYGARPTFRWSLPNEEAYAKKYGTSYTAFKLKVFEEVSSGVTNTVYDSGVRRLPAQDANGVFSWTPDLTAGDLTTKGATFKATGNYTWQVAVYNAKFTPTTRDSRWEGSDVPSPRAVFSIAANAQQPINDHGYSSIDVAVKYAGPSAVLEKVADLTTLAGKVRVQAFANPDFSGDPLSETVVTDEVDARTVTTPNAKLVGLPATGTYYVRAYIDTDGDHAHSAWESYGQSAAVTLTTSTKKTPSVTVWIEDCDTDQDWLPDAWEMVKNGSLTSAGANIATDGQILFSTAAFNAAKISRASISTSLEGASLTIFENGSFAQQILGTSGNTVTTVDDIRAAVADQVKVQSGTFRITSMSLGSDGKVTLTVDGSVAPTASGQLLSSVYRMATATSKTVALKVYRKTTLAQAGWDDAGTYAAEIGAGEQSITVDVGVTAEDMMSGFYKIDVVE